MNDNNVLKKMAQMDEQLFLTLFNYNSPKWLKTAALGLSKSGNGGLYLLMCGAVWWLNTNEQHQFLTDHQFLQSLLCILFLNLQQTI